MSVDLRKLAAEVLGPAALEERFAPRQLSAVDAILLQKQASTDPDLMRVAATLNPDAVLETYEKLGGVWHKRPPGYDGPLVDGKPIPQSFKGDTLDYVEHLWRQDDLAEKKKKNGKKTPSRT